MALFNVSVWQKSRFTLQWFIINLVGSLACLTAVALAQFEWSEGVSGSVSIPDVAFTCLGNLAVFMTAFTRGRLDMENGARDVLATTRGPKLNAINGCGLTTRPRNDLGRVDVVMLSKYNHSSFTQFMQYISHSHALESIFLQFSPFTSAAVTAEICICHSGGACHCVVFSATEEIMIMLARQLPLTLKRLSDDQCLLPSLFCLNNRCHGCNQGLLCVEDLRDVEAAGGNPEWRLREDNPRVDSPAAAVCELLDEFLIEEVENSCICIPVHPGNADPWTKFMIKFLKSKGKEAKGSKVVVSDVLQHYITQSDQELGYVCRTPTGCTFVSETYHSASLILPRVAEVIVNIVLVGWLRVDGFSSSLVARRAIRDHVVDSAGTGFGANAFLTRAVVFCSANKTNVCQVLCFRGGILSARSVSYMVGFVNLICSIAWSVLLACEGYWAPAAPLSTPRVAVIIGAVGVALGMDCFELFGGQGRAREWSRARADAQARADARAWDQARAQARVWAQAHACCDAMFHVLHAWALIGAAAQTWFRSRSRFQVQVWAGDRACARLWWLLMVVFVEVDCILLFVAVLRRQKALEIGVYSVMHMKKGQERGVYGDMKSRVLYGGMQVLVWVKWGIGSFLLGDNATQDEEESPYLWIGNRGTWVYCSAFLLNAMLAAVRRKWKYSI